MAEKFTRHELYDLVWSEPMRTLAARFELSDVGLAKACKRANIPRPPRGYWAKLKVGKKAYYRQPLPERRPGMADDVEIGGGGGYWDSYYQSEEEILNSVPQQPVFDDPIENVEKRAKTMIGQVAVPKTMVKAHRLIRRLLDADEGRRLKQLSARYPSSWDDPLYDGPFEKRRLRVLNAIFVALERCGRTNAKGGICTGTFRLIVRRTPYLYIPFLYLSQRSNDS